MNKCKITFKITKNFNIQYRNFIECLVGISGETDILDRKSDKELWQERKEEVGTKYIIISYFTNEEIRCIEKKFDIEIEGV